MPTRISTAVKIRAPSEIDRNFLAVAYRGQRDGRHEERPDPPGVRVDHPEADRTDQRHEDEEKSRDDEPRPDLFEIPLPGRGTGL